MKLLSVTIAFLILLSGCATSQPEATEGALPVMVVEETVPPTTEPAETDPVEQLLLSMTVEERVGQLFLARCPDDTALEDIQAYHLGGYILFSRDIKGHTPYSLAKTVDGWQSASEIPLLIAVDEEGGTVCRVSNVHTFRDEPFPSPRSLYDAGGMDAVLRIEEEKAMLLQDSRINVNMAPVCDITTTAGAFMYPRSLGQSPEVTAEFISGTVAIMASQQVGSVLKHFPGYGNNSDTHTGLSRDHRSLEQLEQADLIPFQAGIDAGCGAILMSHTIVTAFDDTLPASLSPAAHDYLREAMGFEGVIVTDDLAMSAITDYYGVEEAAVLAVLAGNDLLCSTEYPRQYRAVLAAVETGRIPADMLDAAVLRVLRWKQALGLLF